MYNNKNRGVCLEDEMAVVLLCEMTLISGYVESVRQTRGKVSIQISFVNTYLFDRVKLLNIYRITCLSK